MYLIVKLIELDLLFRSVLLRTRFHKEGGRAFFCCQIRKEWQQELYDRVGIAIRKKSERTYFQYVPTIRIK